MSTKPSNPDAALERDPVCGMTVNPANAKHVYEHAGKPYYCCCAGCVEKFKADPAKYLTAPARPSGLVILGAAKPISSNQPSPRATKPVAYVCPMCPQVHEPKPGSCPSCGMALEPEMPVAPSPRIEFTCPMHP